MKNFLKRNGVIILLCLFMLAVMLPGLGRPFMWQDEAETALLARSILENGVPRAWTGNNIITQTSGNDSNANYLWTLTPWLPFYIVAASFKILGEGDFAGRLPFVIFGVLSLAMLYLFVTCFTKDKRLAVLSAFLMAVNFQLILYSRQCKYYSLLFFVPPILFYAYSRLNKYYFFIFTLCSIVIFYTNFVSLFLILAGLFLYTVIIKRKGRVTAFFIMSSCITLACAAPFLMLGDFGRSSSLVGSLPSFVVYFEKLVRHIWYFNNMVFGLVLFIPLVIFYRRGIFSDVEKGLIKFLLWIIFPAWVLLPLFDQDVFRYNLALLPLFCVLTALLVKAFFRRSLALGVVFFLLIVATNIFSTFPSIVGGLVVKTTGVKLETMARNGKTRDYFQKLDRLLERLTVRKVLTRYVLKSEYAAYATMLFGRYPDAMGETVLFLKENAGEGDVVYANFDLLPLMFYLPKLKYGCQVDPEKLAAGKNPPLPGYILSSDKVQWYFFRDTKMILGPYVTDSYFKKRTISSGKRLIPFDLGVSSLFWDIGWPQRFGPYINKMLWREKQEHQNVIIYKVTM